MSVFAEFALGDGVIASCPFEGDKKPAADAVYVVEIDGAMEFGRFIRLSGAHAPCHAYLVGSSMHLADAAELAKLPGNEEAATRARGVFFKWVSENRRTVLTVRMRFSVRRERLSMLVHTAEFVNLAPVIEILEKRFQTRVSARITSPREIAGAIGGAGVCGCHLCCNSGICIRSSVDIKMAKQQAMPLHDSAAMGLCGKLKCCISYEMDSTAAVPAPVSSPEKK
jgi:cell fate regulator YaaT (PSP1 superfamily)